MVFERTKNEILIRLLSNVDTNGLQKLVDYLSYSKSKIKSKK